MPATQTDNCLPSPSGLDQAHGIPQSDDFDMYDWRDQKLVAAVRTGSSAAFEELHKLYSKCLYRKIFSITRNREDAEDALQDTFMRAFLKIDSFQGRSRLSTWLTRIAINSALMAIRRRPCAGFEISLTTPWEMEAGGQEFDLRDSAPTPEQICDLTQRFDRMFSAIRRLDPTSQAAIQIQLDQECSMKEVANTLDVSLSAVKARLHRARKQLSRHVDPGGPRHVSQKRKEIGPALEQQHA